MIFAYPWLWSLLALWYIHHYHGFHAVASYLTLALFLILLNSIVASYQIHWLYHEQNQRLSAYLGWFYGLMALYAGLHWIKAYRRRSILNRSLSSAYRYFDKPYRVITLYVKEKPLAHQIMWQRYLRDNRRWQVSLWLMIFSYLWLRSYLVWHLA